MTSAKRPQKLSRNILNISFIVILLAIFSLATLFTVHLGQRAHENLSSDLRVLANILGNRSKAALVFYDQRLATENLKAAKFRDGVTKVCLYDSTNVLFTQFFVNQIDTCRQELSEPPDALLISDSHIEVYEEIIDADEVIGAIIVKASKAQISDALFKSSLASIPVILFIIVVAYIALKRKIKKALSPLALLHNTAEEISENPFSSKRAVSVKNDEVGRLVKVFNGMLDELAKENKALLDSETRFKSLSQNAPIGIFQIDRDSNFIYTNHKWHELTGLIKVDNIGLYEKFISNIEENYHSSVLEKAKQTKAPQLLEYQFDIAGQQRLFLEHIAPIFSRDEEEFKGYIGSLMDISELKNAQMELEKLAFYDPLTDLPNRRFFMDYLNLALADKHGNKHFAVMMLDVDNFKKINDTMGHGMGDKTLKVVGERLQRFVSSQDVVSRLGGDEFIILLMSVEPTSKLRLIAERVLDAVRQPIRVGDHDFDATCSIGIATYPEDAENTSDLLRKADLALYQSKDKGRNQISFFSSSLERTITEKVDLEAKLKKAIQLGHLSYHVQPKLSLKTNKITSAEVLIRWKDPDEGYIGPDRFIPIAEETNLILVISDWLLDSVFEKISANLAELQRLGITSFAINLSAKQFYSETLADKIKSGIEKYAIPTSLIELELTESSVIEDVEIAVEIMERLKKIGCKISIDDFGTGYSSLAYLKRFPIDYVKIDRSFIMDIPHDTNDVEISSAIIAMGHSLGLEIVAEGVETLEQIQFLSEKECEYAQGYHISKPIPFDQLLAEAEEINSRFS